MPPAETTGSPAGGYAPTGPAVTGGTPGSTLPPVFRQAPTPDQAFPPPPAKESYPICKKVSMTAACRRARPRTRRSAARVAKQG